jgi:hypothetical protein
LNMRKKRQVNKYKINILLAIHGMFVRAHPANICLYVCGSRENVTQINTGFFSASANNILRSQWPRRLRRGSAAARLLELWVRIPPRAWMSVCCEWCIFSGRGLCDELITRPEESYRVWCIVVCDLETPLMRKS